MKWRGKTILGTDALEHWEWEKCFFVICNYGKRGLVVDTILSLRDMARLFLKP